MKDYLKKQSGAAIIVIILVIVLAVAGGGAAFLGIRMVVSGDGNFLQPFEELGWIDSEDEDEEEAKEDTKKSKKDDDKEDEEDDDDEDEDKDTKKSKKDKKDSKDEDDKDDKDDKKSTDKKSASKTNYQVEESRLSSESKKSDVEHYYGKLSLADEMDSDDEYADLYNLMEAGINLYAKDGKAVEIEFGFDITEFCKKAYEQYPDDFSTMGVSSADDLQSMMMNMIESMFDDESEEYSDYITKYVDGGSFQLYVTDKGFESLYETYGIEDGEDDVDVLIKSIEDAFNTEMSLVD